MAGLSGLFERIVQQQLEKGLIGKAPAVVTRAETPTVGRVMKHQLDYIGSSTRNLYENEATRRRNVVIKPGDSVDEIAKKFSTPSIPIEHAEPGNTLRKREILENHARSVAARQADAAQKHANIQGLDFSGDDYLKVYDKWFKSQLRANIDSAGGVEDRVFTTPNGWAAMTPDLAPKTNSIYSVSLGSEGKKLGGGQDVYDAMLSATRNLGETNMSHQLLDKNAYRKLVSTAGQNLRFGDNKHIDFEPGHFSAPNSFVPSYEDFKTLTPNEQLGYYLMAERDHANQAVNWASGSQKGLSQFKQYHPEDPLSNATNYNENRRWIDAVISGKANPSRDGTGPGFGIGNASIRRAMFTDSLMSDFDNRFANGLRPPEGGLYVSPDEIHDVNYYKGLFKKGGLARAHFAEGGSMDSITPTPRDGALGWIADALKSAREFANKVGNTGGTGPRILQGNWGDAVLGKMPEEVDNWAYGSPPIHTTEMGVGPQWYPGRAQSFGDTALNLAPFAKPAVKGVKAVAKGAGEAIDRSMQTGEGAMAKLFPGAMPQYAIKPKGGNWDELAGTMPEEARKFLMSEDIESPHVSRRLQEAMDTLIPRDRQTRRYAEGGQVKKYAIDAFINRIPAHV